MMSRFRKIWFSLLLLLWVAYPSFQLGRLDMITGLQHQSWDWISVALFFCVLACTAYIPWWITSEVK